MAGGNRPLTPYPKTQRPDTCPSAGVVATDPKAVSRVRIARSPGRGPSAPEDPIPRMPPPRGGPPVRVHAPSPRASSLAGHPLPDPGPPAPAPWPKACLRPLRCADFDDKRRRPPRSRPVPATHAFHARTIPADREPGKIALRRGLSGSRPRRRPPGGRDRIGSPPDPKPGSRRRRSGRRPSPMPAGPRRTGRWEPGDAARREAQAPLPGPPARHRALLPSTDPAPCVRKRGRGADPQREGSRPR